MKIQVEQRYQQPIEQVFAAFCDRGLLEEKLQFLGSRNVTIHRLEASPTHFEAQITREVPAEAPAMLKKFIAEWNTMHQKEQWKGSPASGFSGSFKVDVEGVPVAVQGSFSLRTEGGATLHRVEVEADSKIPLIGKKLAEFVVSKSKESLLNEFAFWADKLKSR